ncbi:hypothetical protein GCM10025868_35050 [Angustibacter aerolatus]|uniref:ABC transporter substrate-binding protein PnrA-like domain-containing protein n=1 Tax=Angustibacter aerolatus TaxID=1162965 RepID=A0ABQ6JNC5_9ACTN|nr:hypothetical protein GCM10025868_35050 [Angustibacter aerolatus]
MGVGFGTARRWTPSPRSTPTCSSCASTATRRRCRTSRCRAFAEQEGSYLVGAAAALKSKSNHIGFIGGNESALITKFYAGYVQGAKAVKNDIKVDDKRLATGDDGAGFGNIDGAKVAAQAMYGNGADIIYTAAGGSFNGSFPVAASTGNLAIGVDSDQYETVGDPKPQKIILTSMIKRVDNAVYLSIKSFKDTGKASGTAYGLKDEGVGYSTSGGKVDDIKSKPGRLPPADHRRQDQGVRDRRRRDRPLT